MGEEPLRILDVAREGRITATGADSAARREDARDGRPALPAGTVTFLFTDVEGSTRLWDRHPEPMRAALVRHDALIEGLVEAHGGCVVRPRGEGDSRFAVFARAVDAIAAAAAIQRALHAEPWPPETPIRVRLALHTGEADLRAGDYYGQAVNRCARLRAAGHGGQTLLTATTAGLAGGALPAGVGLRDLGERRLKDLVRPERVYQLVVPGLPDTFPPLDTLVARPTDLPVRAAPLVGREGREGEVAAVGAARNRLGPPAGTFRHGARGRARAAPPPREGSPSPRASTVIPRPRPFRQRGRGRSYHAFSRGGAEPLAPDYRHPTSPIASRLVRAAWRTTSTPASDRTEWAAATS